MTVFRLYQSVSSHRRRRGLLLKSWWCHFRTWQIRELSTDGGVRWTHSCLEWWIMFTVGLYALCGRSQPQIVADKRLDPSSESN